MQTDLSAEEQMEIRLGQEEAESARSYLGSGTDKVEEKGLEPS